MRSLHHRDVLAFVWMGQREWHSLKQVLPRCRVPYIVALLRKGLAIPEERIRIGSGREGWTLGAALAEGGRVGIGRPLIEKVTHPPPCTRSRCQPECAPVSAQRWCPARGHQK